MSGNAVWADWTQSGGHISGTWTEDTRCPAGVPNAGSLVTGDPILLTGVVANGSITLTIDFIPGNQADNTVLVGTISDSSLRLPGGVLRPGTQQDYNSLVKALPTPPTTTDPTDTPAECAGF
ncbi:MAG: hypothetical protein WCF24_08165 [Acidimicrobiales bacterium]